MRLQFLAGRSPGARKGAALVLAAILMVVMVGMVAFAVDIGYVTLVQSELQRAADASALAGCNQLQMLREQQNLYGAPTLDEIKNRVRDAVLTTAKLHLAGAVSLGVAYENDFAAGDLQIGFIADKSKPSVIVFGTTQPNAVRVVLRRDKTMNTPAKLFFARVLGFTESNITALATAMFQDNITGFRIPEGSPITSSLLPFAMDVRAWKEAIQVDPNAPLGSAMRTDGADSFSWNYSNNGVSGGNDGLPEVRLFPIEAGTGGGVTPGNFGTIDIGGQDNSTQVLSRQIRYGPNASDLAYYPNNTFGLGPDGTLDVNGDTGLSTGIKDDVVAITGLPRTIPLYETVINPGNNATYRLVAFVGVTILDVKLTGKAEDRAITIQPAPSVDPSAQSSGGDTNTGTSANAFLPITLVE